MAGPYGPRVSDVVHKYLNNQPLVPNQGLDSADPDSIPWLWLPQPCRRGGGCEGTSPSGIGTRHGVAVPGRGGSGSRRDSGSGTGAQPESARRARRGSGAGAATRSKGEPAYPMSYIGAGEGLRPFEPPTGESAPLAPPSPPPLPPLPPPPVRRHDAPCEGVDTRCLHPTGLYPGGGGQSVPTCVHCGFPGTAWTTTARNAPSESGALGLLKGRATSCATSMRRPPFVRWPPI